MKHVWCYLWLDLYDVTIPSLCVSGPQSGRCVYTWSHLSCSCNICWHYHLCFVLGGHCDYVHCFQVSKEAAILLYMGLHYEWFACILLGTLLVTYYFSSAINIHALHLASGLMEPCMHLWKKNKMSSQRCRRRHLLLACWEMSSNWDPVYNN